MSFFIRKKVIYFVEVWPLRYQVLIYCEMSIYIEQNILRIVHLTFDM